MNTATREILIERLLRAQAAWLVATREIDRLKKYGVNHAFESQPTERCERTILSSGKKLQIAAGQAWKCTLSSDLLPAEFEMDHIVPLRFGGNNSLSNYQALCGNCHAKKSSLENQLHAEWQAEKKTGRSRFFQPCNLSCKINHETDNWYLHNRHRTRADPHPPITTANNNTLNDGRNEKVL